ncbi:site-2 protease family protein [Selenomonas sp. TAMA-11512]|uniref:site-2 protease family protein n=1 Tax=Selenomonas sp. TAMA-11512 TaxID=3095337 RepID=UPI0030867091|nr:site-2 protease family protein [Selenomonas sp. TAMA-11512]
MFDFDLATLIAFIPGILIAMVIHEYSHARMAVAMGDFTPRMMGRLTLNPIAHVDWIGLLMLFFVHFGWAKPVMYNPRNFHDVRKGELLTALAGPASNIIVAFLAYAFFVLYQQTGLYLSDGLFLVLRSIILININFAVFNMLPLPPLDGSKVLMTFLPGNLAYQLMQLERYSFIILILLLYLGPIRTILVGMSSFILTVFQAFFSVFFI